MEGESQKIEGKTGEKVLGFLGVAGQVAKDTEVNFEQLNADSSIPADSNQDWIFNSIDNEPDGFFTLTSEKTHLLLHGNSEGDAYVGFEDYSPPLNYEDDPKSKSITSRKLPNSTIAEVFY